MKYVKISSVLCLISLFCALLIAGFNMLTNPVITNNASQKEFETCQAIFADYDQKMSEEKNDYEDKAIIKKVLAKDSSGNELGYLYTVSGKNAYGGITLMVAIKNDTVYQVEFLDNGQSFASTVVDHVKSKYPSSKENKVVIDPYNKNDKADVEVSPLDKDSLDSINTTCGATFGANLVKELVSVALNDAKGVK